MAMPRPMVPAPRTPTLETGRRRVSFDKPGIFAAWRWAKNRCRSAFDCRDVSSSLNKRASTASPCGNGSSDAFIACTIARSAGIGAAVGGGAFERGLEESLRNGRRVDGTLAGATRSRGPGRRVPAHMTVPGPADRRRRSDPRGRVAAPATRRWIARWRSCRARARHRSAEAGAACRGSPAASRASPRGIRTGPPRWPAASGRPAQFQPAAEYRAVQRCNDRPGRRLDAGQDAIEWRRRERRLVERGDVATRNEGAARTGDHECPGGAVLLKALDRALQPVDHIGRDRVDRRVVDAQELRWSPSIAPEST